MDFSKCDDLIPAETIALMQLRLKYGDGVDGVLTRTQDGSAEGLKGVATVIEGEYSRKKVFVFWLITGTTDGQKSMAEYNLVLIKRVIASGKYLDLSDKSPEAIAKYKMEFRDFDGFRFLAEIGVEAGKDGFSDKNIIARAITRDMRQWNNRPPIEQVPAGFASGSPTGGEGQAPKATSSASAPAPITKPAWAS
jgi:hypothetical protein